MKYISECSLAKITDALKAGEITPFDILNKCCKRFKEVDYKIKSFLAETVNCEKLEKNLKALTESVDSISDKYPFLGIPIGIKDIFHIEGYQTKAGSLLPPEILTGNESFLVTKIKNFGGLIFGKTVTTEFAYFKAGKTRNPHNIEHTPGGSSSGSAAAVAAGIVPFSIGTQTIGSIIRPASYCGIYGFKPSQKRLPTDGIIPFSPTVDQVGFFAQDLKSIGYASALLCKDWKKEEFGFGNIKIGIPADEYLNQAEGYILKEFGKIVKKLQSEGLQIQKFDILKNVKEINDLHNDLIAYEFYRVHKKWFTDYSHLYSKKATELIEKGKKISSSQKEEILAHKKRLTKRITDFTLKEDIDLWLMPATTSVAPKGLSSTGNPIMNLPWTFFGFPVISIPVGFINGLPWALQAVDLYDQDEKLLKKVEFLINRV